MVYLSQSCDSWSVSSYLGCGWQFLSLGSCNVTCPLVVIVGFLAWIVVSCSISWPPAMGVLPFQQLFIAAAALATLLAWEAFLRTVFCLLPLDHIVFHGILFSCSSGILLLECCGQPSFLHSAVYVQIRAAYQH